ncbi:MAG TPA: hydantoinase/oxoprolinase family protein, partial [Halomonas sp.]|nr:hydantoinase/oxoprolinase family protein [Halomonas sp.]
PIVFPSIEVLTVGAGGGSLAHIDIAGALRNGPQSAGADPGPACYERGGTEPTNTDANLALNRLGTVLAGGALELNRAKATQVIDECVGQRLSLDTAEAAQAVIKVANANMADAVRLVSIRRGLDPRDFALIAFGGAGALHGAEVAKELGIPAVIVPPNPGVTSAMGCLLVDIQHDLSMMYTAAAESADLEDLDRQFRSLEEEAVERLRHEGVADADVVLQRGISMRYQGQWRSLQVAMGSGDASLEDAIEMFHQEHERQFSFRQNALPVEIYQLHLRAVGKTPKPEFPRSERVPDAQAAPHAHREVYFEGQWHHTPVYDRATLPVGFEFSGPAIIDQLDSTTVVPPDTLASIDEWKNIRIQLIQSGEEA